MFNTIHNHRHAGPYPQTVTHHEHRAPTDESVRLLREMEQKAQDSILYSLICKGNGFNCRAIVYQNHLKNVMEIRVNFTLGESKHDVTAEVDGWNVRSIDDLAVAVRDILAKEIANRVVVSLTHDMLRGRCSP